MRRFIARTKVNPVKLIFGCLWISLFLIALTLWWRSGIALTEIPDLLEHWLNSACLLKAALIYILIYTVRPLVLFPATLLTIASGLIFGPWLGTLFTIVGENTSANLGFSLSRWFGRKLVKTHLSIIDRWGEKLAQKGIIAVITMRLLMLPFDAVNFGCGLTAIQHRDFAIGTFIGILPSLIGFVLLGGVAASGVKNRLLILLLSLCFMLLGLSIARLLKLREKQVNSVELNSKAIR